MGSGALHVRRPSKLTKNLREITSFLTVLCSLCPSTHPAFIRADYADTEPTEDLLTWTHPHLESPSTASSNANAVIFTEAENLAMLRLPRKECKRIYNFLAKNDDNSSFFFLFLIYRSDLTSRNTQSLPDPPDPPLRLRLRRTHNAARPNTRKRMDDRSAHTSFLRARPTSILSSFPTYPETNEERLGTGL